MHSARWQLEGSEENRKQLYWGAFMLGCATFHQHRRAGYWLDGMLLEEVAQRRFRSCTEHSDYRVPYVDDQRLGLACFTDGFVAGYQQRACRLGLDGLELREEIGPADTLL